MHMSKLDKMLKLQFVTFADILPDTKKVLNWRVWKTKSF